jgi:hypothetical protein
MQGKPRHAHLVDWTTLLPVMRRHKPLARIGAECGLCEQTINRLARGDVADPHFSQGIRLLDLAADLLTEEEWARVRRASLGVPHG